MTVYSEREKFLFIHIPKTGGMSISAQLRRYFQWDDYRFNLGLHVSAKVLSERGLRKRFSEIYKFAVVRNPWEKMASTYFHFVKREKRVSDCTFEQFVKHPESLVYRKHSGKEIPLLEEAPIFATQFSMISIDNQIVMNKVLRFESLNEDWRTLCHERQWSDSVAELGHKNQGDRSLYPGIYTSDLIKIVEEKYQEDICCFGYSFPDYLRAIK